MATAKKLLEKCSHLKHSLVSNRQPVKTIKDCGSSSIVIVVGDNKDLLKIWTFLTILFYSTVLSTYHIKH